MKKFGIGLVSIVLAQSLNAIVAEHWWQLDERYNPPPNPLPNPIPMTNPLVIYENSALNVSTNQQTLGWDLWVAGVRLDHNLTINAKIVGINQADQTSSIFSVGGGIQGLNEAEFNGIGKLGVMIDSAGANPAAGIFNLEGGKRLTFNVKTNIATTQNSRIVSIFRNFRGELTFNDDLIVDLSNAQGDFMAPQVNGYKVIFDNRGTINVNPNNNALVQLTGDIANFAQGRINLNLSNANSFFQGRVGNFGTTTINLSSAGSFFKGEMNVYDAGSATFNLSNGSSAEVDLNLIGQPNPTFTMHLLSDSVAKIKTSFNTLSAIINFTISNASLYADFFPPANTLNNSIIELNSGGVWYLSQTHNRFDQLEINNDPGMITTDRLKSLKELSAVDMRFEKQGGALRDVRTYDKATRYLLEMQRIGGGGGIFRLTGVLNQAGWGGKEGVKQDETIATDQIIVGNENTDGKISGKHHVQLFWNNNTLDKSLINKDLSEHKIVVAKQYSTDNAPEFLGAITPVGVYNYITNLKKEDMTYGNNQTGKRWIVKDVQRADNSYLARLLDSAFQTQYRIFKMESDSFNQRMGELRDMQRVHGVWLRVKYGQLNSKSIAQTVGSWDNFTSVQIGYDQNYTVLGGKNFFGLALSTTAFDHNGIGEKEDSEPKSYYGGVQTYGFSLYNTYIFDNGFYIDSLAKYYLADHRFSIYSEVLRGNKPKFFTHGVLGSLEIGKKFRLPIKTPDFQNSFYYLRPELQFTFGFTSGANWDFKDWTNQMVKSRLDFNLPANFRTGLMFGREFNKPFLRGEVYLGTSIEYDINTGGDLRLEDFIDKMTLSHRGNFNWRINAGTHLSLNEYWRLYFDIDASFFGKINSTFTLNGGVRINFGQLHPRMPYIAPDQEGSFGDSSEKYRKDRRTIPEVQNYETYGIINNGKASKRPVYKPPVKIKKRAYGGDSRVPDPILFGVSPQGKQAPQGEVQFVDDGAPQAPQKNYKRDENQPILQTPQRNREMQGIKERLNQGFRQ